MSSQTKNKILEAAQRVMADKGVAGMSHRAIAKSAGVRLSMTSYHLGSMDDILEACFDDFAARSLRHLDKLNSDLIAHLEKHGGRQENLSDTVQVLHGVIDLLAQYIHDEVIDRNLDLALECAFLYSYHLPEAIRHKVRDFDETMYAAASELTRRFGSNDPETDGRIIVKVIRQVEFDHLSNKRVPDMEYLRTILGRAMIGFVAASMIGIS